ncbi:unnamed protein product [Durusdinium trenchii]|uniref:Histone-lysine N-methyltransferase, H3 lysine-79 specific n=1 Tax=Durusdinium trenchii TaxID=1381693 RepID=A0ABP0LNL1_9DINO
MAKELLAVRLVLDAPPEKVAAALDKALLHGDPGSLQKEDLPMPDPILLEWQEFIRQDCTFSSEALRHGAKDVERHSCSLGLRPLCRGDKASPLPLQPFDDFAFEVNLAKRAASRIRVLGRWTSSFEDDSAHGFFLKVEVPFGPEYLQRIQLSQLCEVKRSSVGSELTRRLLCDDFLQQTRHEDMKDSTVAIARLHSFMIEIEARAWAICHGFALIESWRGLREDYPWALKSAENAVAAYRFGSGHSGPAQKEVWPLFDTGRAQSLSEGLFEMLPAVCNKRMELQGALQEGNVEVESFASLLDRICRRADSCADIFRRFVDLGSGRGMAVFTAHALFPFRSCVGFEISPEYNESARLLAQWYVKEGFANGMHVLPDLMFIQGDVLTEDWSDASVVFANCVTWPSTLVAAVARKALRLRPGAVMISGKRLPSEAAVMRGFDFRGEACLGDWTPYAVELWVYQRIIISEFVDIKYQNI